MAFDLQFCLCNSFVASDAAGAQAGSDVQPGYRRSAGTRRETEVSEVMKRNIDTERDVATRGLWLAIIVLGSMMAATLTCVVFRLLGVDLATALGTGGAAFVATMTLGIAARKYLSD